MLTQERLISLLDYYPEAGVFVWKGITRSKRNDLIGTQAGRVNSLGYFIIKADGRAYRAHQLAWLYIHGSMPTGQIDHINRDKCDNRIANLRLATPSQNQANRPISRNNTSGYKGVVKCGRKWRAVIYRDNKQIYLGSFGTPQEAHDAYARATQRLNGQFGRAA